MTKYTLESLIKTFSEHAFETEEARKKYMKQFKEDYPNEPLPDYMLKDFNLPLAFVCICEELLKLREKK